MPVQDIWQEKKGKFVILSIDFREDIFPVHFYSESESNSLKSIQRITNFPGFQISCTGNAGTRIQILGSCSAHPLLVSHLTHVTTNSVNVEKSFSCVLRTFLLLPSVLEVHIFTYFHSLVCCGSNHAIGLI